MSLLYWVEIKGMRAKNLKARILENRSKLIKNEYGLIDLLANDKWGL